MKPVEYFASPSIAEASESLARYAGNARGVAGGTDLLMASIQIRNLATIGGNLCNAAPSAERTTR